MKILQIIQKPQLRGAEIFASQLSVELEKLGHKVDVLYLFDMPEIALKYPLNYFGLNGNIKKRFTDFKAYKKLALIIKDGGYDIVQANAGDTLKYAALSRLIFGWKNTLVFRNANKMGAFIKSSIHKKLNQFFLRQVDHFISVSENCRQDLIQLYKHAEKCSTTITIGTYLFDEIKPIPKYAEKVWINVGSFVPEKNHSFLIEVFAKYVEENENAQLWLVGDGKLRKKLETKVSELDLTHSIKFLGFRNDVISLIKAADIMVMPSKIEGLPGVILEAMSCKVPVVASNVGGIPEVIIDGKTGYVLREFKAINYLNIINILDQSDVYQKVQSNQRRMIQKTFLMDKISNEFESLYFKIFR
ncbi:glycosyltransferase family 4 protein [Fulvivirga maritima]|uniref:glycosyltransferase family 4 protein n=1 Tax=Fulvivirga maritima TaxID=2904247 RepID=UPI001F1EFD1B|nr:glycosyltransferase family 4 protein [Fulvivirga maritima]UII24842.1 glycosyltransferase family 4 protein [Fulvivirga maritima]